MALLVAGVLSTTAETYTTTVNQRENSGVWVEVGTFAFQGGTGEYIEISNEGANGYVIVDAVRITGNGWSRIIDDLDNDLVERFGTWGQSSAVQGFYGTGYSHDQDTRGDPLKWMRFFPDFPRSGDYTASLLWTSAGNRATNVPVTVLYNITPAPHALTVINGAGSGDYIRGTEVFLEADPPPEGKTFARWISSSGGSFADRYNSVTSFIMPHDEVTVTSVYYDDPPALSVRETARSLPIAAEVDVAVIGSGLGAIGTAIEAANAGASVLLIGPDPCPGRDIGGENRYWLADGEIPESGLAQKLFGTRPSAEGDFFISPGAFKKQVEAALENSGVDFLYAAHAVDAVVDWNNKLSGVVIASKAGRQAVRANAVVDATPMAGFAQIAGAAMEVWPAGAPVSVSRTHYYSDDTDISGGIVRGNYREFATEVALTTGSWIERCRTEMRVRGLFDTGTESWSAQYMHLIEPRGIVGEAYESAVPWVGAGAVDLGICKPVNKNYLYVIGSACSVSRKHAAALARPLEMLELGRRLGIEVQAVAAARSRPEALRVAASASGPVAEGLDTAESLSGVRPFQQVQRIPQPEHTLPVDGIYDVIVAGGGSAGTPAAIGAARAGAKVLLIEQLGILGGTGVNGIGIFWKGYRQGFAIEHSTHSWAANAKAFYYREAIENAGGEIWYNTRAVGVIKNGNKVCGVIVATPTGRRAVLGEVIIDGTGDGDLYAWAGADYIFGGGKEGNFSLQDSGFHGDHADPTSYNNHSHVFTDPGDLYSATWFRVLSRRHTTHSDKFDHYPLSGIRGSRRLVGDYVITALDQYRGRTYSDVIAVASSNWDNHGWHREKNGYAGLFPDGRSFIPYRALLPRGIEGLLVTGRCKSVENDALPLVRMQSDLANEGYAAGVAAAMSVQAGVALRNVDLPALQAHLRSVRNLPGMESGIYEEMPDPTDAELEAAAADPAVLDNMAALLVDPARSLPFLIAAFNADPSVSKAKAIGFCGGTNGVVYLSEWLDSQSLTFDGGNGRVTPVDSAIRALGYAGDERALPALLAKLAECGTGDSSFTHVRAVALSLGEIGSPEAAPALQAYLEQPGMTRLVRTVEEGRAAIVGTPGHTAAAHELIAAAALYRCGDPDGLAGERLAAYLDDWRGPLRRFAAEVLSYKSTPRGIPYSWFEEHGLPADDESAWRAFWSGTDPAIPGDDFKMTGLTPGGQLSWRGGHNLFGTPFRIYGSTDLSAPWTLITSVPRAESGTNVFQVPQIWLQNPSVFFRVEAAMSD